MADRERPSSSSCSRSMCGQGAPRRPRLQLLPPPERIGLLSMHGLLSYIELKCGAIGPVLKHGPRSYTLPRVEGDLDEPYTRSESKSRPSPPLPSVTGGRGGNKGGCNKRVTAHPVVVASNTAL